MRLSVPTIFRFPRPTPLVRVVVVRAGPLGDLDAHGELEVAADVRVRDDGEREVVGAGLEVEVEAEGVLALQGDLFDGEERAGRLLADDELDMIDAD